MILERMSKIFTSGTPPNRGGRLLSLAHLAAKTHFRNISEYL